MGESFVVDFENLQGVFCVGRAVLELNDHQHGGTVANGPGAMAAAAIYWRQKASALWSRTSG